jgi:hypothetical protein
MAANVDGITDIMDQTECGIARVGAQPLGASGIR